MNHAGPDTSFDVLVLGGGAAGCVLAARLSEDPARRVCLVEAGPDYGPYAAGRWPSSLLDARTDGAIAAVGGGAPESHDWGFPGVSASRARVIGGCSSHNGCEVMWGSHVDYDEWAEACGDPGWSYAAFAPYLERASRRLRVRPSRMEDLAPVRRVLMDTASDLGLPFLPDLNAREARVGAGLIPVNAVGSLRWGAAFAYLDQARGRPGLTILPDTTVDRIVVDTGQARGAVVLRDGRLEELSADVVILAAGAYGTPAILQRSGIGAANQLRALGIRVVADLPGVGQGLLDHPYVLMSWVTTDGPSAIDPPFALAEIKWASSRCPTGSWDVTVGAWSGHVFDQRAHGAGLRAGLAPCAMKTRSEGRVTIRSSDPLVLPTIDHGFLSDPAGADLDVLCEAVEFGRAIGATPSWRKSSGGEITPGAAVKDGALRDWIRSSAAGTYHPCGTCRMGRDSDPRSVVDPTGHVRGVADLIVADASVFPTIPAANIHVTVVALAERVADILVGEVGA